MGTFTLCAAFVDAMALTYSAGLKIARNDAGKWSVFMETFFGEAYRALWDSYSDFRCLLLFTTSRRLTDWASPTARRGHGFIFRREMGGSCFTGRASSQTLSARSMRSTRKFAPMPTCRPARSRTLTATHPWDSSSGRSAECHTRLARLGAVSGRQCHRRACCERRRPFERGLIAQAPAQNRPTPSAAA